MSEQTSIPDFTPPVMPDLTLPGTPVPAQESEEDKLKCPICGRVAKSPSGKILHVNSHNRKKPKKTTAKKRQAKEEPKKQRPLFTTGHKGLREVYYDGNGRVLLVDRNGRWWRAMELDVVE